MIWLEAGMPSHLAASTCTFLVQGRNRRIFMKFFLMASLLGVSLDSTAQVYRCPDAQGKPVYSNVSCVPGQRPIPMSGTGASATGGNASSVMQLMDSASKEKDSEKRRSLHQSVRLAVAAFKAQALAEAMEKSEMTAGVPSLTQQLKDAELRDRADPQWPQFRSDSPITAGIRQQLTSAREHATRLAPNLLATNVDYARVMARAADLENSK